MPRLDLSKLRSLFATGAPSPVIGVDFGTRTLKCLQISGAENPTMLAAASVEVPDALLCDSFKRLDWQMRQLPALLKKSGFVGRRAACCVPTAMMFCKHLQLSLPESDPGAIVAGSIAEQLICDAKALEVRHRVVAATNGGRSEVLAMAVGRGLIQRMLAGVKSAGLEMVALHPETLSMLRSFDPVTRRDGDDQVTSLYLDIGASATRVVIAHGKEPVFIKSIGIGGATLDSLIRDQLKCTLSEARAKRLAASAMTARPVEGEQAVRRPISGGATAVVARTGIPAIDAAMEAEAAKGAAVGEALEDASRTKSTSPLTAVLERRSMAAPTGFTQVDETINDKPVHEAVEGLADEVAMCVRYHSALFPGRRVERVYFVGGESACGDIAAFVARKLRLQAHVADPLARIARNSQIKTPGVDLTRPQPGWAAAVGLCCGPTDL
jgi:Tfp pilus assembly PilM family ATPase